MEDDSTPLHNGKLADGQSRAAVVSPKAQPRYPDQPLNREEREIRLLYLSPAPFRGQLRGHLRVVKLASAPEYEALSYTWGTRTLGKHIHLNGNLDVHITDHLYFALRGLRHAFTTRVLWVDAICIDQTNDVERGHQVAFMGPIYETASRMCIWLGQPTWHSWTAEIVLRVISPLFVSKRQRAAEDEYDEYDDYKVVKRDKYVRFANWYWAKYYQVISSSLAQNDPQWHTRAWVYQEIFLAAKTLWCTGRYQYEASGYEYYTVLAYLNMADEVLRHNRPNEHRDMEAFQEHIHQLSRMWVEPGKRHSICWHQARCKRTHASDPRDKVFSLLGIMNLDESKLIIPDYSKPHQQVFATATFASITGPDALGILADVTSHKPGLSLKCLPTWAFNFNVGGSSDPNFSGFRVTHRFVKLQVTERPSYSPNAAAISSDAMRLSLSVVILDQVEAAEKLEVPDNDGQLNLPRGSIPIRLAQIPISNRFIAAVMSRDHD